MKNKTHALENSLSSLGLSEKEAAVYLALLELGRSTVSKIARAAGVNRATGYVVLDSLIGKGLAQISGKEPKQEYEAESPDNLLAMLRARRDEADARIEEADALVPQLKSIRKVEDRPQVKFYEGNEGLRQVYEDTLTATEEIRAYGSYEVERSEFGDYIPHYYARRAAKDIRVRGIAPETELSVARRAAGEKEKRTLALVPADRFSPKPEIDIYDDKVMIASWQEKLGIIIRSGEIADAMKKLFELAWIGAKHLEKSMPEGKPETATQLH